MATGDDTVAVAVSIAEAEAGAGAGDCGVAGAAVTGGVGAAPESSARTECSERRGSSGGVSSRAESCSTCSRPQALSQSLMST